MITIPKSLIKEWLLLNAYSEIHIAQDKIRFFEKKYNTSFSEFEKKFKTQPEDFKLYDDYIEWKAYLKVLDNSQKRIQEIKRGNIKIS